MSNAILKIETKSGTQDGYVYVFKRLGAYKIGCSTDIFRREKTLNNACKYKYKGEMVYYLYSQTYMSTEYSIQVDMKKCKLSGEWFVFTNEDIEYLKSKYGFKEVIK